MFLHGKILILFIALAAATVSSPPSQDDPVKKDCTYKGFKLHGKIKFVDNFPDIKIKIVENFPDLKVKLVQDFPYECGEWQIVENFPDIKVQVVENFPDIKVKFVENFPGLP